MRIMLRRGLTLRQGSFTAVIAPEQVILSALNDNPDLGRYLFLFLCGNYSRILSRVNRTSSNFEICRPFTADQLLTALREAGHTVIFLEHDATLFDGADRLLGPVSAALREAGHEALVILYSPAMDKSFAALAGHADRLIEIVPDGEPAGPASGHWGRHDHGRSRRGSPLSPAQKTLGGFGTGQNPAPAAARSLPADPGQLTGRALSARTLPVATSAEEDDGVDS